MKRTIYCLDKLIKIKVRGRTAQMSIYEHYVIKEDKVGWFGKVKKKAGLYREVFGGEDELVKKLPFI